MKPKKSPRRNARPATVAPAQRSLASLLYENGEIHPDALGSLTALPVDKIVENGANGRQTYDKDELEALARSMRENGLLEPILVRSRPKGHYELVAGSRRVRAAKILGWDTIGAIVRDDVTEAGVRSASAVENLQRVNLAPYEEALAYQGLLDKGLTQDEAAQACGVGVTTVKARLALLKLPEAIAKRAGEPGYSEAHLAVLNAYAGVEGALDKLAPLLGSKHNWRGELLTASDFRDEANRVLKSSGKVLSPTDWKLHALKERSSKLRKALAAAPTLKGDKSYNDVKVVTPELKAALKEAKEKAAEERVEERGPERKIDHAFEDAVREGGLALRKARIPKIVKARVDLGPKELVLLADAFVTGWDEGDVDVYAEASGFGVDELRKAFGSRGAGLWLQKAAKKDASGIGRLLLAHALIQGLDSYGHSGVAEEWIGLTRKESESQARKTLRAEQKTGAAKEKTIRAAGAKTPAGTCEVCGCTEDEACDPPCSWANKDKTRCTTAACVDGVNAKGKRVAPALTGEALRAADIAGAIGDGDVDETEDAEVDA